MVSNKNKASFKPIGPKKIVNYVFNVPTQLPSQWAQLVDDLSERRGYWGNSIPVEYSPDIHVSKTVNVDEMILSRSGYANCDYFSY